MSPAPVENMLGSSKTMALQEYLDTFMNHSYSLEWISIYSLEMLAFIMYADAFEQCPKTTSIVTWCYSTEVNCHILSFSFFCCQFGEEFTLLII